MNLTPSIHYNNRLLLFNSLSLSLRVKPLSNQSLLLIEGLLIDLAKGKVYLPFRKALSSLVGDLLHCAASNPLSYRHRSVGGSAFRNQPFGYDAFIGAFKGLVAGGYIETVAGKRGSGGPGTATRMRATGKLIAAALGHGITLNRISEHFGYGPYVPDEHHPVIMREEATKEGQERHQGRDLALDEDHPLIRREIDRVNRFNAFVSQQVVTPCRDWSLRRIYCDIKDPALYGRFGGRLYGSYQNIEKGERVSWRINGEPLEGLDISGCFLTIYMQRAGQPLDHANDPYDVPWPQREIVKAYINGSLGAGKLLTQWPKPIVDRLENPKDEKALPIHEVRKRFRVPAVRDAVTGLHPLLKKITNVGLRWGDLHFLESEVMFSTIERLAYDHNIATLPIHDAIYVPISAMAIARQILTDEFQRRIGAMPKIKVENLQGGLALAA